MSVGASGTHGSFSPGLAHGPRQTSHTGLACEASWSLLALVTFGAWRSHGASVTFDTRESHFTSEPLETYGTWGPLRARRAIGTFGTHRTRDTGGPVRTWFTSSASLPFLSKPRWPWFTTRSHGAFSPSLAHGSFHARISHAAFLPLWSFRATEAQGSGDAWSPREPTVSFRALTSHVTFRARVSPEVSVLLLRHQPLPHEQPERLLAVAIQPGLAHSCPYAGCRLQAVLAALPQGVLTVHHAAPHPLQLIHAGSQLPHLLAQSNEAEEQPQEQQPGEQQAQQPFPPAAAGATRAPSRCRAPRAPTTAAAAAAALTAGARASELLVYSRFTSTRSRPHG